MKPIPKNTIVAAFAIAVMATPAVPAFAGGVVYIPLGDAGEVAVVDTARNEVVGKIEGLPAVHGLAGTPDGRFLIAGSFLEHEAGAEAPAKPAAVSEDDHAAHHAAPPANQNASQKANPLVSTVSVVRKTDSSVVRRIDVPGAVHHVAVSPDGRFAVVTRPNGGGISAIDLDSYKVVANVSTGPQPNYAAFSPDGNQVYVSNAGNGRISAVDAKRWAVTWSIAAGPNPEHVVLSKDGATLYVNNVEAGTVSVVSIDDKKVAEIIQVGSSLHGIDLSDDGKTLFIAALGANKLMAVDLATGASRNATLAPGPYHLAAIRGTGKLYVSSTDEPKVWVVDQEKLTVLDEILTGGKGHQMVQSAEQ